jgi:hypothetical protein
MPNLRIFGSPIHDTALVFIVTSTLVSIFFNTISELGDSDTLEFKPKLPANFTFYKEKDKYYIQYSKVINKWA